MIKWDPAGSLLASCSEDDIALLWSPKQNEYIQAYKGHEEHINALRWSSNFQGSTQTPSILATGSRDRSIKLWDVEYGKCILTLNGHE